jgi:cysteinyl-tRNA synthetase
MSLIFDLSELTKQCTRMEQKAQVQQTIYFKLINGIVKMHQEARIAKNYKSSDDLRELLKTVGVTVTQGTAGYEYDKIPLSLKGRKSDDTWTIEH